MNKNKRTQLSTLPYEMIWNVMIFLPIIEIYNVSKVCKIFFEVQQKENFWKEMCEIRKIKEQKKEGQKKLSWKKTLLLYESSTSCVNFDENLDLFSLDVWCVCSSKEIKDFILKEISKDIIFNEKEKKEGFWMKLKFSKSESISCNLKGGFLSYDLIYSSKDSQKKTIQIIKSSNSLNFSNSIDGCEINFLDSLVIIFYDENDLKSYFLFEENEDLVDFMRMWTNCSFISINNFQKKNFNNKSGREINPLSINQNCLSLVSNIIRKTVNDYVFFHKDEIKNLKKRKFLKGENPCPIV